MHGVNYAEVPEGAYPLTHAMRAFFKRVAESILRSSPFLSDGSVKRWGGKETSV